MVSIGLGWLALTLMGNGVVAPYTASLEKLEPPVPLSAEHRTLLDPRSLVVRDGRGTVMRAWFRKEIPVQATRQEFKTGLNYRNIPEGTLVGAIEFPRTFVDYRRQRIPSGTYTLRFAVQPDTGDHTDTSPHREFLLICPAAVDTSMRAIPPKRMIEFSSRVNQGRHPAVLLLWPNSRPDPEVLIVDKGKATWAVSVRRPVAAGAWKSHLGFAITVSGKWLQ